MKSFFFDFTENDLGRLGDEYADLQRKYKQLEQQQQPQQQQPQQEPVQSGKPDQQ